MTSWTLILRSLRFHARSHLGTVLGAAVGTAALVGALVVGDSVRGSLRDMALARLGRADTAMMSGDRFFRAQLEDEIHPSEKSLAAAVLELPGMAVSEDGTARANHVQILGVDGKFWQLANQSPGLGDLSADDLALNDALATQLRVKAGDTVLLRIEKPSLLSRDAPISPQEDLSVAFRLKVRAVVSDAQFGRFSLQANQAAPFDAFVNLARLEQKVNQAGRANLLLCATGDNGSGRASTAEAEHSLREHWELPDGELELRALPEAGGFELRSDRVFLDPAAVESARGAIKDAEPIITYFVNRISSPPFRTPYSMVTAMGEPVVPADMRDNEILVNNWLAEDMELQPGETISLTYYVIGNGRALEERTNSFKVRGIVPMSGPAGDRTLMPDFPGLAQAESSRDWDAGFPIDLKQIRDKDEQYWKEYRGTPKAFVTLAAGKQMWANRFGEYTAVRFPLDSSGETLESVGKVIRQHLDPASFGLSFQPVREQALAASSQATDFGGLFIGFSFFLIVAALLLMALLFQFGLEQRTSEIGTLLALGFRARQVRRLLLWEGAALAMVGGIIGALGGIFYAKAMLLGLRTVWRSAVGTSSLHYHATPETLAMGTLAGVVVAVLTIWLALRRQGRRPARELLAEGASGERGWSSFRSGTKDRGWRKNAGLWIGTVSAITALGLIVTAIAKNETSSADTFFCAGALLLIQGLGFSAAWLAMAASRDGGKSETAGKKQHLTLGRLGVRGCARRRKRSLATIGLLASGVFLIVAVGAFRIDANANPSFRSSGTGGFELFGESTLPITYDLNGKSGRDFYGLNSPEMKLARVVGFRVHDGDEASCLNLNRAQTPRLLGVNPKALEDRQAFTFTKQIDATPDSKDWGLLQGKVQKSSSGVDEIPAIGDENSILWAMGKKVGDTVDYTDEHGRAFKLRLVGALANSVLQGSLIIDEAEFVKRFPGESGYRMFLLDVPSKQVTQVSATMTRALQDEGLELTPTTRRLDAFNAVQNTYLSTFQVLGGLGLLLGSAGLGVVVLRNVQERRGELGLMLAVGFRRRALDRLVLSEHGALLALGLCVGLIAAAIGVLPALLSPAARIPYGSLAVTLAAVLLNGLLWTWLATRFALRGRLLDALKNE
jgi:ABC-type antimicrobial peptide transport system permease subunit